MRTYLLTGATSGLGLETAKNIAARDRSSLIMVGARRPNEAHELRNAVPPNQLWVGEFDGASLKSVAKFATAVSERLDGKRLDGLALNAGVQIVSGKKMSVDGFELTFATNVLGNAALFLALVSNGGSVDVVVSTASGTHDPDHKLARPYGFRGGFFPSIERVASGEVSDAGSEIEAGRDRYATSKLCNVLFTYGMARRCGEDGPRFIAYDPGLMPGTGLARDHSGAVRLAWRTVLPQAAKLIDGASTSKRSGEMLADLLSGEVHPNGSGLHIEFTGRAIPSSKLSHDPPAQDALIQFCEAALKQAGK